MVFDSSLVCLVLKEINSRLIDKVVKDIKEAEEGFSLEFGKGLFLNFSLEKRNFCSFMWDVPLFPLKGVDSPFTLLLKKHLIGKTFVGGYQLDFDRIIALDFEVVYPGKLVERKRLFVEFIPAKLNMILVGSGREIICSWRKLLHCNSNFYLPPYSNKVNPLLYNQFNPFLFENNLYQGLSKNLLSYVKSFSSIESGWNSWLNSLMREDIKPTLFISREGVPLDFWFLDYSFTDAYRKKYFNGVSDLMGYFLVEKKRIERDIEERIRRNKEIEDRRSYLLKKREKLRETISREGEIRRLELIGEMIFANLSSIPDKASRIKLSNPYTGELEDVELDPSLTPALNAQRYFKEAAKLRRGIEKAKYELNKVEEELAKLSAVNISPLPDREGMEKREEKSEKRDGKAFREFEYKGWVILVGKGASSNEELTFRISSDDDIWLHVKGSPGSHVVIRNPLKQEVPLDVLEFAASLAAYYSKAKMNTKVPVDYTLVKYVKRHPAGKRGAVLISNQRTIWVRPRSGEIF